MAFLTFGKTEMCSWKNPNISKCDFIIPIIYKWIQVILTKCVGNGEPLCDKNLQDIIRVKQANVTW